MWRKSPRLSWTSCHNFPSGCKHIVHSCKHHSDGSAARGTCMASPWWCVAWSDGAPGGHLCALLGWTCLGVMFLPGCVCISPLSLTKGRHEPLLFPLNFLSFFLFPDYASSHGLKESLCCVKEVRLQSTVVTMWKWGSCRRCVIGSVPPAGLPRDPFSSILHSLLIVPGA